MTKEKIPVISVLRTKPKTVLEDYKKLMHLAEYEQFISKKKETILKLNLSWSLYYPACSTEPWQLEGVLKTMIDDGYKNIHPVENRTVVTDVWKGAKGNKWLPILKKYDQVYEPLTETKWVSFKSKHELLALDKLFPDDYKLPEIYFGKNVVHLPTVKTHGHTMMTGAMKNAFGGLITKRRHHSHKIIHEVLVDLLTIQKEIHLGLFAVMDGTVCGDGKGPRTMEPVIKNIILAGADQVAIDAISAKMMGFDPLKIPFIKIAHDKGLGCGDVDQIEITGISRSDFNSINFNFQTGKSPVVFFDQLFRKKLKFVEPLIFHTPLFHLCVAGSGIYHDKLWYPTLGKAKIEKFMNTGWGELWNKYPY
ncbi:MAG: DUF362 domain-containing protein [Candidatus Woesearchaeota archaeon]|jgi:uncharacterized protein (DUF362 family)